MVLQQPLYMPLFTTENFSVPSLDFIRWKTLHEKLRGNLVFVAFDGTLLSLSLDGIFYSFCHSLFVFPTPFAIVKTKLKLRIWQHAEQQFFYYTHSRIWLTDYYIKPDSSYQSRLEKAIISYIWFYHISDKEASFTRSFLKEQS